MAVWLCKPTTTATNNAQNDQRFINYTACCTLLKLLLLAQKAAKYSGSKYKYVKYLEVNGKGYWALNYPNVSQTSYPTEREAALAIDKYLIRKGKEPVNILVRK